MADAMATQPHNLPLHISREKCEGKTYIVTGANVGLGLEAAKHLVAVGAAKVIMAVRNVSAGETAKAEIEAATGTSGVAEVWAIDLSSYESVKAFAKRAVADLERIDALIENAGVAAFDRTKAEGHLINITVNVISTLLLAVLLLPKMSDDAKKFGIVPHIVAVSSRVGFDVQADWNLIKSDPLVEVDNEEHQGLKLYVTMGPIH
jgi:NAD(P)-dependent dehydrogenase (short-subunit alcohol dehydrogenase family)